MIIKEQLIPKGLPARSGLILSKPTSITIHWIGPYPNQEVTTPRAWWLKGPDGQGMQASAHYVIKNDDVLQCIPTGEVAWHCGSKGNYVSIGIEIIPMNIAGEFSTKSIDSLGELLKVLPKVELLRHYDWTCKNCPLFYTPAAVDGKGEERWITLKKDLMELRDGYTD